MFSTSRRLLTESDEDNLVSSDKWVWHESRRLPPRQILISKSVNDDCLSFNWYNDEKMAEASKAELLEWPKKDKRHFLHVVYRVGDLDRTIEFYTECFGMKLLRKRDVPEETYSNAFLGFGPEVSNFVVELTYI